MEFPEQELDEIPVSTFWLADNPESGLRIGFDVVSCRLILVEPEGQVWSVDVSEVKTKTRKKRTGKSQEEE